MIKIIDLPKEERPKDFFDPPYFIIDGKDIFIKPIKQTPYGYATPIGIYDSEGLIFEIHDKPTVTPLYIATNNHHNIRKSFFTDDTGTIFNDETFPKTCIDPRVIMARILIWWAFPEESEFDIIERALTPLPTIEQAENWLVLNRFKGANRKGEEGKPGYWMDQSAILKNVPTTIRVIHDRKQY